jgi:hypothetical protein
METGQVVIVTNAKKSWVYASALQLLPKTYEAIQKGVHVISARENHESSTQIDKWKQSAFLKLKEDKFVKFDEDLITNLIVVGDSKYEMEAAETLSRTIEKCVLKSVKLSEAPSTTELIKQLTMLNEKWDYVLSTFKNLNIRLERKPGAIVNS